MPVVDIHPRQAEDWCNIRRRGKASEERSERRDFGYIRCSTLEQADSALGLEAQEAKIRAEAERRGLPVVALLSDAGISGASSERPGLGEALGLLKAGKASMLVVAKIDRLARSMKMFASVMETSLAEGWALVTLDLAGVDTSTPAGSMVANVTAAVAQYERQLISQRTKDALGQKRARGERLGRPAVLASAVVERISVERAAGGTWTAIAGRLNDDAVATAQGGAAWYPATVRYVSHAADRGVYERQAS